MSRVARKINLLEDSNKKIPKANVLFVSGLTGNGKIEDNRYSRGVVFYEQHSATNIAQFIHPKGNGGDCFEFYSFLDQSTFMREYGKATTKDISSSAYARRLSGEISHEELEGEIKKQFIPIRTLFGGFDDETKGQFSSFFGEEHLTSQIRHDGEQFRYKNLMFKACASMGDDCINSVASFFMPQVKELSLQDIVNLQAVCEKIDNMQFTHDILKTPDFGHEMDSME